MDMKTGLKVGLGVFFAGWLGLVALVSPPDTIGGWALLLAMVAVVFFIAYWFYYFAFRLLGKLRKKDDGD